MARKCTGTADIIYSTTQACATTTSYSQCLWYKPAHIPSGSSDERVCGTWKGTDSSIDMGLSWNNPTAAYRGAWYHANGFPACKYLSAFTAGTWYHLGITYDGVTMRAYYNGTQDVTTTTGSLPSVSATGCGIYINERSMGPTNGATGSFADYGYWKGVLTAGEMLAMARGLHPNYIRPGILAAYVPLLGSPSPEIDFTPAATRTTVSYTISGASWASDSNPPMTVMTPRWGRFVDTAAAAPPATTPQRTLMGVGV